MSIKTYSFNEMHIRYESESNMLCLTDLYKIIGTAYNRPDRIFKNSKDRVYFILANKKKAVLDIAKFDAIVKEQGILSVLKQVNAFQTLGARQSKAIWCNINLFLLYAFEVSQDAYNKVKKFDCFTDPEMINRIEAGSKFSYEFCEALAEIKPINTKTGIDYKTISILLNYAMFGKDEYGIRNKITRQQLSELNKAQYFFAYCIFTGLIKTESELVNIMKLYFKTKQSND